MVHLTGVNFSRNNKTEHSKRMDETNICRTLEDVYKRLSKMFYNFHKHLHFGKFFSELDHLFKVTDSRSPEDPLLFLAAVGNLSANCWSLYFGVQGKPIFGVSRRLSR